jgi:hypothetical protein
VDKKRTKDGKHSSPDRLTKKEKKEKRQRNKETQEEEDEDDDDDDDEEEDSPWICCDSCGQWLLAKGKSIHA